MFYPIFMLSRKKIVLFFSYSFHAFLQRLLSSFVSRLFTVNSFESDFPLVLDVDGVKGKNVSMPDGIRYFMILVHAVFTQSLDNQRRLKDFKFVTDSFARIGRVSRYARKFNVVLPSFACGVQS